MPKRFPALLAALTLLLSSCISCAFCAGCAYFAFQRDLLAYQSGPLEVEAVVTVDGEPSVLHISLAAPGEEGREASLAFPEDSLLSDVRFEKRADGVFVTSGVLAIPVSDEATVSAVGRIVRLFEIPADGFLSSERKDADGVPCTYAVYEKDGWRWTLTLDDETLLPGTITLDGADGSLAADVTVLSAGG